MPYVDWNAIPGGKVGPPFARELKIALAPETHPDVQGFTFIISTLDPHGGCTDLHTHAEAGELMIFMTGHGKAWLDNVEHEIKPGVAIYAPPGVPHKTLNTGSEPLTIACVFVPSIPTDYIRANIAAAQKAGEQT